MTITEDMAKAYKEILTKTGYPPEVIIVPGSYILKLRPDLIDEILPEKVYIVTKESIEEMEHVD